MFKKKCKMLLVGALGMVSFAVSSFADNPIISQRFTADPNAFVFENRLYIICSSDEDNVDGYNLLNYTLVSTDDMVNWTDHNLVFKVKSVTSWAGQAYAPTAITRDGKVYLFFPNGSEGVGVAVADKPEGPYRDHAGKAIVDRNTPNCSRDKIEWLFDPCIFIDTTENGIQAYLTFGGGQPYGKNLYIVKVNDDMKSISGIPQQIEAPQSFEGPFLHKYKNKYYFSYPTSGTSKIDYMMSDNPMNGWDYKGTILENPTLNNVNINRNNNSHESMLEYKGKWYMFYHDRRISNADYKRNICVDELNYNEDGTIKKVIVTSEGVPQIKKFNPYDTIQSETIWKQEGIETDFFDGGVMVTDIDNGDYTSLKGVDFGDGAKSFEVMASCESGGGSVEVHLDNPNGTLVASCEISSTGNWQTWKSFSCDVTNCSGVKNVYFVYKGNGKSFRLNWFKFVPENVGINKTSLRTNVPGKNKNVVVNPFNSVKINNGKAFDLSGRNMTNASKKVPSKNVSINRMLIIKNTK